MKALARGALEGDAVVVRDVAEANRLHNKALAGTPLPGNALRLDLAEAAHCVAQGWLEVQGPQGPLHWADVVAAGPAESGIRHLVYRDLRDRGLAVRVAGPGRFDVWPRGKGLQGAPEYQVVAAGADDPVHGSDLVPGAAAGLVAAVVDGDGTVTHYRLDVATPRGEVPRVPVPACRGRPLAGGVLVADASAVAALRQQWIGTPIGDAQLLSPLDADAGREAGWLQGGDASGASSSSGSSGPGMAVPAALRVAARALREAGIVVRSGLRFGTHLRGYTGDPDAGHAPWLVHCTSGDDELGWTTLARGVRLAHGVKKEFLVAVAQTNGGRATAFVRVAWFRP